MLPRSLGEPKYAHRPIRWPTKQNLQTQIEQIKAASQPANLSKTSSANVASANQPKAVQGVNTSIRQSGTNRIVTVHFTRGLDPFFQSVNVYLKLGNQQPSFVTSSSTSPIVFTTPKTTASATVIVQSAGNWGPSPITSSPTSSLRLT